MPEFFNQPVKNENIVDLMHTSCIGALSQCLAEMKEKNKLYGIIFCCLCYTHIYRCKINKNSLEKLPPCNIFTVLVTKFACFLA